MAVENQNLLFINPVLPDGNGGFTPCPELLTEEEAIRYLRLDAGGSPKPIKTMEYYRNKDQIVAVQVGKVNRYRRQDLDDFLAQKSDGKRQKLGLMSRTS